MKTDDTADKKATPPRLRLKLSTVGDIRAELARVYRGAKVGNIAIGDASRLANILFILSRIIEGSDMELRIAKLEAYREST
jgi:hypothetical protein